MALQPHSRIESQLTDPTYKGPYLSRIELILKDYIANAGKLGFRGPYDSVEDLPNPGEEGYIYLVEPDDPESDDYDEYYYNSTDGKYHAMGSLRVDLTNYYTKDEVNTLLEAISGAEFVQSLPSASVDTMEKLYVLMTTDSDPGLYVTTVNNNVYTWFKLSGSDVEEITASEADADFEAVFRSGTTQSNLISLTPEVFDTDTIVDTVYEGTPTDKSTYITGDTYDFDYSNYERLKITGCNYSVAQGVDGRWIQSGDIAIIDNPQEGDTFDIKSDGGRYLQGTYVFTSTGIRRTRNVYNQCGIFSIIAYHPNVTVDSI